jgi:fatty acid desaturase
MKNKRKKKSSVKPNKQFLTKRRRRRRRILLMITFLWLTMLLFRAILVEVKGDPTCGRT